MRHGARYLGDGRTHFSVWSPWTSQVQLLVDDEPAGVLGREHAGYHVGIFPAEPGARYRYRLDERGPFADPASRSQPEGVHGPSEVVAELSGADPAWRGLARSAYVICEVHVGAFSQAGTFDALAEALPELAAAGYSALECMPVAAFPGTRNWGYDGVFPFAVQQSYGGREGLARLADAAHRQNMALVLDVVYNHIGPEGAVLQEYGPYLTDRYKTPWGPAVNVDGSGSDEVRRFFVEHAVTAVRELGVDGFRLDAAHEIPDRSAHPFLAELTEALHAEGRRLGRTITVVAESPANDPRLVSPEGLDLDGVWNDDYHHSLRVALTGEQDRYFGDYSGTPDLAKACTAGFVVAGRYSPSRGSRHGAPGKVAGERLVVFAQNHDQIGNGGYGHRLAEQLPLEAQFPITALVCCSGQVPLRFMGEEYGEKAPFHYFTDHSDPALIEGVRKGRREEVGGGEEAPDPQDPATFAACRPNRDLAKDGVHAELAEFQRKLLALRKAEPSLGALEPERSSCYFEGQVLFLLRRADELLGARPVVVAVNLGAEPVELAPPLLSDCRLDVLASRGAPQGRLTPTPDGTVLVHLEGYGVLIAGVVEPAPGHFAESAGIR
ncbi:MAG: malto-oligosyltrehalose trehalohydrolase [Acidimicrobiaceae bacterium]|nr:malto-oligosyltrehalose trehalohydrolase [Acidimicrobiaceae bacterium]